MPSVVLVSPRDGTTTSVTSLGDLDFFLRRAWTVQSGTVADARAQFPEYSVPSPGPLETYGAVGLSKPGWRHGWFGGALRNMGSAGGYWQPISDAAHWPFGIDHVETSTVSINVFYDFAASGIGTVLAVPDETMAAAGWTAGASVFPDRCEIKIARNLSLADQIRFDGTNWVASSGLFTPTWSTNQLLLDHQRIYGHDYSITSRGPLIANMSTSGATDPAVQTRVQFYDPRAAGALVTTPSTDMRVYVTRRDQNGVNGYLNPQVAPDTTASPTHNLWLLGVHHHARPTS